MNNKKGDVGKYALVAELLKKDIIVCLPVSDGTRFDLICGSKPFKRLQIKEMFTEKRGAHILLNYSQNSRGKLRSIKKVYSKDYIDFLVGYVREDGTFYIIPIEELKGRRSIVIWHNSKPKIKAHQRGWNHIHNRFDLLA